MTESNDWTNFAELRICGLMRSGNHAIIDWICEQHRDSPICFLNNVRHGLFDPYSNYAQRVLTNIDQAIDTESLRALKKRLLVYSYEDRAGIAARNCDLLESAFGREFEPLREGFFGKSRHRMNILIVRDPFNCFASRLKLIRGRGPLGGERDSGAIAGAWKSLARKALQLENHPEPEWLTIKYNNWVSDPSYRQQLSESLHGNFSDSSIQSISNFGGGSSFQPTPLSVREILTRWKELLNISRYRKLGYYLKRLTANRSQELGVFDRWKLYVDDEEFQDMVCDNELLELSEALFGEIAGTRAFISKCGATRA